VSSQQQQQQQQHAAATTSRTSVISPSQWSVTSPFSLSSDDEDICVQTTASTGGKRGSAVTRASTTNQKAKGAAAVNGFAAFLKTLKPADAKTAIASATRYSRVVKEQSGSESYAFKSHFQVRNKTMFHVYASLIQSFT
jgi:hypothetical protein